MAQDALVSADITEATSFLDAMEQLDFPVTSAFWWLDPETEAWHLFVASPKVREVGPRSAYELARQALSDSASRLQLSQIKLVGSANRLVQSLASGVNIPGPGWSSVRVSRSNFNGQDIHDAILLRSTRG